MGMASGARVPVAAMDNSRSKGSRKGSNLITAIAATFSCEVCRTCTGAGGEHATSPEASRRHGLAPPAGHVLFPLRSTPPPDGGAVIAHHRVGRRTRLGPMAGTTGDLGPAHLFLGESRP